MANNDSTKGTVTLLSGGPFQHKSPSEWRGLILDGEILGDFVGWGMSILIFLLGGTPGPQILQKKELGPLVFDRRCFFSFPRFFWFYWNWALTKIGWTFNQLLDFRLMYWVPKCSFWGYTPENQHVRCDWKGARFVFHKSYFRGHVGEVSFGELPFQFQKVKRLVTHTWEPVHWMIHSVDPQERLDALHRFPLSGGRCLVRQPKWGFTKLESIKGNSIRNSGTPSHPKLVWRVWFMGIWEKGVPLLEFFCWRNRKTEALKKSITQEVQVVHPTFCKPWDPMDHPTCLDQKNPFFGRHLLVNPNLPFLREIHWVNQLSIPTLSQPQSK